MPANNLIPEVRAMSDIQKALDALDIEEVARVLAWIKARYMAKDNPQAYAS